MKQLPLVLIPLAEIEDEGSGLARFRHQLGDITALKVSIKENGLLTPPLVWLPKATKHRRKERYVVLDGSRRLAAMRELAQVWPADKGSFPLAEITCSVYEGSLSNARTQSILAHLDGAVRAETNRGDEALAAQWLLDQDWDQNQVANMLRLTQGWVSQSATLVARLGEKAMAALRNGEINKAEADGLAGTPRKGAVDVEQQDARLEEMLKGTEKRADSE